MNVEYSVGKALVRAVVAQNHREYIFVPYFAANRRERAMRHVARMAQYVALRAIVIFPLFNYFFRERSDFRSVCSLALDRAVVPVE